MLNKSDLKHCRHKWRLTPLLILLCALILPTFPVTADSLIVLSRESDSYLKVAGSIKSNLQAPSTSITLKALAEKGYNTEGYQNVIAIGSRAADSLFNRMPATQALYASFLPRQTYHGLLNRNKNSPRIQQGKTTAIYLDQPYSRQLYLAKLISPQAKTVATALGPNSKNDLSLLEAAATDQDLEFRYEVLQESDNPIHKLQPLIRRADLFLSLPDKSVFNRTTAKWILYISFRQRIPLIGFSQKYVEAGALAAVYSTPEQIGQQTAELINHNNSADTLPTPQYPRYFSVATNKKAANSLNMRIPSEDALTQKLMEQGQ